LSGYQMTNLIKTCLSETLQFSQLDQYCSGDAEFRKKLIELMIDNIIELQRSLCSSFEQKDIAIFLRACHKAKTTLSILDNLAFTNVVGALKAGQAGCEGAALFDNLCDHIIKSLVHERDRQ
jgi:hypothetical protein